MPSRRLPIYARWTLLALGAVERPGSARPRCPVCDYLLARRPSLAPNDADLERLTAVRMRTEISDALLLQIHDQARAQGQALAMWTLGAGFDGRWARLAGPLAGATSRWVEVEDARLLALKSELLSDSPFGALWSRVESIGMAPGGWGIEARVGERPVVVLEGMLHRLSARGLSALLRAIAQQAPGAHAVLDLTGVQGLARAGWSGRRLATLGWSVVDDVELSPRDGLYDVLNRPVCAGAVPVRVVHLLAG